MAEVLFEFTKIGNSTKVSAIDTETLTEVSVIVPSAMSENQMKLQALQKLRYILENKHQS